MGFWDSFTGAAQRRDLDTAYNDSTGMVKTGYGNARTNVNQGTNAARSNYGQARRAIGTGVNRASDTTRSYLDKSTGYISPYMQQGQEANSLYGQHLGLQGAEAQREAVQGYMQDPFREFNDRQTQNAIMRRYNAAGMLDSGASRLASARALQETGTRDYQGYLDRLAGLGSQGGQFARQAASLAANAGSQIGGYQYGGGHSRANIYGQQAGLADNLGRTLADLDLGEYGTLASNRINQGNALAESRGAGLNNLLKVLETVAKFIPKPTPGAPS